MARFPFSMPGRKKSAPQLTLTEPMSKAHRVLGATPLSIDTPPHWDDNSSSGFSDEHSGPKSTGFPDSWTREFDEHHPLDIARSDNGWGEESDIIPHPLRGDAVDLGDGSDVGKSAESSLMRKSRSSSTIRSWYDRSKMPLAISQQTSSSAMAKGVPTKAERLLDVGDFHAPRPKKKPGKLDLAALVSGARAPKKGSHPHQQGRGSLLGTEYITKSPSVLTPTTPTTRRHQGHSAGEGRRPSVNDGSGSGPATDGSNQWPPNNALSELPSLYDHYEQMSLRQIMKHEPMPEISLPVSEEQGVKAQSSSLSSSRRSSKTYDWLHQDPSPATPQTAMFTKPLEPSSPANNYATSVSSRVTRASRTSRNVDQGLKIADLHQTSVLVLSSDSEDDNEDLASSTTTATTAATTTTAPKSPIAVSIRRPSTVDDDMSSLDSSHPTSKRGKNSDKRSSKSSKRTSFAPSNTYILIHDDKERSKSLQAESRASTPHGNVSQATSVSSRRASIASTYSGNSAVTWHSRSGYSIKEARAVTMHQTRRPSNADSEQDEPHGPMEFDHNVFQRESLASSGDQLTPPLSPTSVDFYGRTGQSSNDAAVSHNRIMAVTRQEELLLAALRHRQDSFRCNVLAQLQESHEEYEDEKPKSRRSSQSDRRSTGHRSKTSQGTVTGPTFDFGFPAPPGFRGERPEGKPYRHRSTSRGSSSQGSSSRHSNRRRSSAAMPSADAYDNDSLSGALTPSLRSMARKGSAGSFGQRSIEEAPAYFDDMEPSPDMSDIQDWDNALSAVSEDPLSDFSWSVPQPAGKRRNQAPSTGSHSLPRKDSLIRSGGERLAGVEEETSEAEADLPRPDSPISPDSFPAVPEKRMTRSNMVRLSAVGSGMLGGGVGLAHMSEPGWWGDDD
ncbi:glutathione-dependent formaldehyde-activating enzyme [Purpureocillium lavendulum]|uniref:Glutathione-dependent formaldehyde-activating enzyme n=1 Tax=Purpureocillium lavendulum TaxID=1247861 RepID=A0AB34FFU2_9HYPO|nr:glutathione-dependent formaldehyde-activating enzyme [Purpureocillium lavendulum]